MVTSLAESIDGVMDRMRRWLFRGGALPAGLLAGSVGLIISFALKGLIPARPLGDPLPMVLAVTQMLRGFTYLQWQPPLFHFSFAVFLGILSFVLVQMFSRGTGSLPGAARAGRIAAILNVGVVALLAVDAVVVGFYYLISGWISVFVTTFAARLAASWWSRRQVS